MVGPVVAIGAVMLVILVLLGFALLKASAKAVYLAYFPLIVIFICGVIMVVMPKMTGKVEMLGAGLGGWGISFLFASVVAGLLTPILDVYLRSGK
ncbi:hypothetical protein P5G51_005960 [Virgibacillus sp. 179-BFC.A HS]|uniref:YesK-like protein n=1 Tax=Tigheibacillus jepli TaxID=3035914 RepID=A0ABU5CF94_9BACI|nr:hypothetical protein [Virgibacillus sp. 179-BFC.A HS]MDY0405006.1 hypothetical protein [Virgibacillus sp. 179-BFC.A HS]